MKKIAVAILVILTVSFASAQKDSLPPYKRFPTVPPLKLLLTDSVSFFTKDDLSGKKKVMIMLFSPDCEHCRQETEEIIKHIDEFGKIHIIMSTTLPFEKMKEFYIKYDMKRFDNITVGKDVNYLLPVFFNIRNLPFLAFYDKKRQLKDVCEGALPVEEILEKFDQ